MSEQGPAVRCPECGGEGSPDSKNRHLCAACYRKLMDEWEASARDEREREERWREEVELDVWGPVEDRY